MKRPPRFCGGAGEGNRTLVVSLGSFCSTIELHPHVECDITQHRENLTVISVFINGAAHILAQSTNIADLMREIGLEGKRIALERNGEIVPRSQFPLLMLTDGDQLEVVVAVGGG